MADSRPTQANRTGAMLVGLAGCTANTAVVACLAHEREQCELGSLIAGLGLDQHREFVPRKNITFGGWDVEQVSARDAAAAHGILPRTLLEGIQSPLADIVPLAPVIGPFDTDEAMASGDLFTDDGVAIARVESDVREFIERNNLDRCVVVYLGPPLRLSAPKADLLPSGAWYALGAIKAGAAFVDFTPNTTLELPSVLEAAQRAGVPIAGRDGSTGQTFLKLVLAGMFSVRNLRIAGWYSANILGNSDGAVLSRDEHRQTKMHDKRAVLPAILGYEPEHVVDITYYRPRGDNKESWDVIDFEGMFALPMSLRLNWQGRDSVLAAPLVVDLIRHMDYSLRYEAIGWQEHLALYFKQPLPTGVISFADAIDRLEGFYR